PVPQRGQQITRSRTGEPAVEECGQCLDGRRLHAQFAYRDGVFGGIGHWLVAFLAVCDIAISRRARSRTGASTIRPSTVITPLDAWSPDASSTLEAHANSSSVGASASAAGPT